ncbi:MAG: dihydropyrimidinase [Oscillospiraceae bacterium]|nr:dihydropyrimidinase [Oscillospiraceae bacterium]
MLLLICNGIVVTAAGAGKADIRVEGEIIYEIGESLKPRAGETVIDAQGKIVMPGGVDVHTHMDLDLGAVRATDDFYTGTVAAACGGTTTIVDHMAFGPRGCSISHQVDAYHKLAQGNAVVDYGFHGVLDHVDDTILAEIESLAGEGITSHKFYLTYDGKITDYEIIKLMDRACGLGVLLTVHAENDGALTWLREKYRAIGAAAGQSAPVFHAMSRPPECEAEAVSRMAWLAAMAGDAPLYIVHLSSKLALERIIEARSRGQENLYAETCPQYLFLDDSLYEREDALKYVMSPPLRSRGNCEALWAALGEGGVDVVATDHCPFFYAKEKQLGKDDFTKTPGGIPGVEPRIPLMFSGTVAGRLTPQRFVALCCENPARLFGLYPKKGVIAAGSDADIVIIDPHSAATLTADMLHENCDYTPYEGLPLPGRPVMTISRGEVIVSDGIFLGRKGRGSFLKRGLPDLSLRS